MLSSHNGGAASTTVVPNLACNLCGSREAAVVGTRSRSGAALRSVCCVHCGLVWADPRPVESRRFYEHDYRVAYKGTFAPRPKHVLRAGRVALSRWAHVQPLLQQRARVLDVGSGGGEFAYLLQARGHEVRGVEPNRGYAEFSAAQYGLAVQRGFIDEVALPADHFDLVTVWHVLEHTDDPAQVLLRLRAALRPGGTLVVEVPNIEATCQSPASTFHEAHVYSFSPATLRRTAEKTGLQVDRLTLSADGGNLTALLRRPLAPSEAPATLHIAGEHDRIVALLRGHRPWRHLMTVHPYRRLAGRLMRALHERWQTRRKLAPRALLDRLYGKAPAPPQRLPLWPLLLVASAVAVALEWLMLDRQDAVLTPVQGTLAYVALDAGLVAAVAWVARDQLATLRRQALAVWGLAVVALPAYC